MSDEDLISYLSGQINKKTTDIILEGIDVKGVQVKLDTYRQADFNALYTTREQLTFPYTIWEDKTDIEITDVAELISISMSVLSFIYDTRREGQQLRIALDDLTHEELINWSDPR